MSRELHPEITFTDHRTCSQHFTLVQLQASEYPPPLRIVEVVADDVVISPPGKLYPVRPGVNTRYFTSVLDSHLFILYWQAGIELYF